LKSAWVKPQRGQRQFGRTGGLLDFLGRSQAQEQVRQKNPVGSLTPWSWRIPRTGQLSAPCRRRSCQVHSALVPSNAAQHMLAHSYIGSPETFVKAWYFSTSLRVIGPGFPVPILRRRSRRRGRFGAGPREEALVALKRS